MKGIKDWAVEIGSNENFASKFESLENPKEIVDLAKKEGYQFTEDELMDLQMEAVSGGIGLGSIFKIGGKIEQGIGRFFNKMANKLLK